MILPLCALMGDANFGYNLHKNLTKQRPTMRILKSQLEKYTSLRVVFLGTLTYHWLPNHCHKNYIILFSDLEGSLLLQETEQMQDRTRSAYKQARRASPAIQIQTQTHLDRTRATVNRATTLFFSPFIGSLEVRILYRISTFFVLWMCDIQVPHEVGHSSWWVWDLCSAHWL